MRRKSRKFFREEVRKTFFFYALIPSIVIAFLVYNLIFFFIMSEVKNENKKMNEKISKQINEEFINYKDEILFLSNTVNLKNQSNMEIYENFYNILSSHKIKAIFYVYDKNGNVLFTNSNTRINSQYYKMGEQAIGVFKSMKENPEKVVFLVNKEYLSSNKRTVYSIGKVLIDSQNKIEGFIVFNILEDEIGSIIYNKSVNTVIVSDKYDRSIISTNDNFLYSMDKVKFSNDKKDYYVYKTEIFDGNIYVYTVSSVIFFNNFYILGLGYIFLLFLIISLCMYIIAKKISIQKTKSIDKLLFAIKEVQRGNLNTVVNIDTNDEFEILGKYYNKMIEKLDLLIKKNKEEARRSSLAELKHLQAQINPHFLYNTLDIIKWSAKFGKNEDVVLMTTNLAKLLRYSINNSGDLVSLRDDVSMIKSYLTIQKMRWNEKLTYTIEIEDGLLEREIPKLLIQPIVENIFKHALTKISDGIIIYIIIREFENNIEIEVSDNGTGIKERKMLEINLNLKKDINLNDSVGLYNVHKRLHLYYGKKFGLEIRSTYLKGTVVKIKIPYKNEV